MFFSYSTEMVCTARIMHLGFKRSGTYDISRWIKQHEHVTAKTGDMFLDNQGSLNFGEFMLWLVAGGGNI